MGPGLLCAAAIGAAAAMARRHHRALPPVAASDAGEADAEGAAIDVVVPARNEEGRIEQCVNSLRHCQGVAGVTVVDDGSTDTTADRAGAAGARLVTTAGPPPGWMGKPHACHLGAETSTADWIAFVDADVMLAPFALASLLQYCRQADVAAASPLLRQRCAGPADRLLVPLAFWQYLVGLPGAAGRRTRTGPRAILNGQCILVKRAVYLSVGGHGHLQVRGSVIEDSALARRLVSAGHAVSLVSGPELGSVQMYEGMASIRAGFGKNIAAFLAADPPRGLMVAAAGVATSSLPGLVIQALRQRSAAAAGGAAAAYLAGLLALRGCYREAGESQWLALAHPAASSAMQAVALESLIRTMLHRRLPWRGRKLD